MATTEDKRQFLDKKRNVLKIGGQIAAAVAIVATIGATAYLGLTLKKVIQNRLQNPGTNPLDYGQSVDEAIFDTFGPQLEILWRALLIANLILVFLFALYMLLAIFLDQYYAILVFDLFLFSEIVLACGTGYYKVEHYWTSMVFLASAFIIHLYCHILRLDIVDELNAVKLANQ